VENRTDLERTHRRLHRAEITILRLKGIMLRRHAETTTLRPRGITPRRHAEITILRPRGITPPHHAEITILRPRGITPPHHAETTILRLNGITLRRRAGSTILRPRGITPQHRAEITILRPRRRIAGDRWVIGSSPVFALANPETSRQRIAPRTIYGHRQPVNAGNEICTTSGAESHARTRCQEPASRTHRRRNPVECRV